MGEGKGRNLDIEDMNIIDGIEKLITEHGSAVILSQQLAFAKDQFIGLERKVSELQTQVGRLEGQLEREKADLQSARHDLQRLKDEHSEEIRIFKLVEFRRGQRTGGKWVAFCPKCHLPAFDTAIGGRPMAGCTAKCGWQTSIDNNFQMLITQIEAE